jgi:hypothetical protein
MPDDSSSVRFAERQLTRAVQGAASFWNWAGKTVHIVGGRRKASMLNRSLLIVDDEPNTISTLKRQLRRESYFIYSANSGDAGLKFLKENDIGVVLSDLMMPKMDGITFLEIAGKSNRMLSESFLQATALLKMPWTVSTVRRFSDI